MSKLGLSGPLPTIFVEQDAYDEIKTKGCIDVIFSSSSLCVPMITSFDRIQIDEDGEQPLILSRHVFSGSLAPDILPLDICRLPVTELNSKAVMQGLNTMLDSLGSVIGIGELKYKETVLNLPQGPTQTVRAYLKLSASSMKLSFKALSCSIPTHFVWHQVPYTMLYAGRSLHDEAVHSASFPLDDGNDEADSSTSSSSGSSSGSSTLVKTPNDDSRKRKRNRE